MNGVRKHLRSSSSVGIHRSICRCMSIGVDHTYFHGPLNTNRNGIDVLHDPIWNKDLAFEYHERDRLGLRGLLPVALQSIDMQVQRVMRELDEEPDDIHRNLFLSDLQNRNETLFNRVLADHVEKVAPLVYTPTVGMVCQQFGFRFNRARGMYLSISDAGLLSTIVHNWPHDDVHIIVVTDGSRILGLGDLGAQGMGIPIGKLALYCACGGVAPHRVLPIQLDVGTNNETLLHDVDYVGLRQPRVQGEAYFRFLDEFMNAVTTRWPNVTVQFEDFETTKALPLLARYRHKYRCFNDDIQGTGAVVLSGLLAASRQVFRPQPQLIDENTNCEGVDANNQESNKTTGENNKNERQIRNTISQEKVQSEKGMLLTEHRILCAGAGAGGLGVCAQILSAMTTISNNTTQKMSKEEAQKHFVICTSKGALGMPDGRYGDPHYHPKTKEFLQSPEKARWRHPNISDGMPMAEVIDIFRPTVLLGLTGKPNTFSEDMLRRATQHCDTPIVLPMSNPSQNSECSAEDAYRWTRGKAIVATGSPFPPVTLSVKDLGSDFRNPSTNGNATPENQKEVTFYPSQCNNMFIFPGLGLACSIGGIKRVTDNLFSAAARACAASVSEEEMCRGQCFPDVKRIRTVSHAVACGVLEEALMLGLVTTFRWEDIEEEGLQRYVDRKMYFPYYVPLL